jgi:hypothetical protein
MLSTLDVETLQNIIILLFLTVVILGYMLNTSNKKYIELTHVINKMSLTPLGSKLPNF